MSMLSELTPASNAIRIVISFLLIKQQSHRVLGITCDSGQQAPGLADHV